MCSCWPAKAAGLQLSWFPSTPEGRSSGIRLRKARRRPNRTRWAPYDTLTRSAGAVGARPLTVTGPLHQTQAGYRLQVRLVEF